TNATPARLRHLCVSLRLANAVVHFFTNSLIRLNSQIGAIEDGSGSTSGFLCNCWQCRETGKGKPSYGTTIDSLRALEPGLKSLHDLQMIIGGSETES